MEKKKLSKKNVRKLRKIEIRNMTLTSQKLKAKKV